MTGLSMGRAARRGSLRATSALVPQPDGLLKFLNEYRSLAITYTCAPAVIDPSLEGRDASTDPAARWSRFAALLVRPWPVIVRQPIAER